MAGVVEFYHQLSPGCIRIVDDHQKFQGWGKAGDAFLCDLLPLDAPDGRIALNAGWV